jgi:hypothetical protein
MPTQECNAAATQVETPTITRLSGIKYPAVTGLPSLCREPVPTRGFVGRVRGFARLEEIQTRTRTRTTRGPKPRVYPQSVSNPRRMQLDHNYTKLARAVSLASDFMCSRERTLRRPGRRRMQMERRELEIVPRKCELSFSSVCAY